MIARAAFIAFAFGGCLAAQDLRGAYRFVHLSYSDGAKLDPATKGGTLSFDGAGVAQWGDVTARYEITGPYEAALTAGTVRLALHFNQDGGVLIGSAAGEAGSRHQLLVAVRAAEGVPLMALRGEYGVATLAVRKGDIPGLATAFAQMTASGLGQFTRASLAGHAADIADVNRREERSGLTYELSSDGTGVAHLGAGSDAFNGDIRIAVSADGGIVLGWSAEPASPALLLGIRKSPDTAVFSFQGRYWLTEAIAENSFEFQRSTRLSSAAGLLSSSRTGQAYISQQVLSGGETSYLATTNQYRLASDGATGALGPKLEAGVDNFAFNETALVSAQVGAAGQLTLSHGLVFGLAAPLRLTFLANAASPSAPDAPVVPGALMLLTGTFGEGARVRVNGVEAQLGPVTADRLPFQVPATFDGGAVLIEVTVDGRVTHSLRTRRAASSPALFTADGTGIGAVQAKLAEPGETVTLTATGLGAAPTLRVLFDGQPGEVSSTAPVEGQPGRFQIVVVVPRDINVQAANTREVPIALATPDSLSDLADLLVTRRPQ